MDQPIRANVHRHCDAVAISVGNGDTTYFTPKMARQLAAAIFKGCRSCESQEFGSSTFKSVSVEEDPALEIHHKQFNQNR